MINWKRKCQKIKFWIDFGTVEMKLPGGWTSIILLQKFVTHGSVQSRSIKTFECPNERITQPVLLSILWKSFSGKVESEDYNICFLNLTRTVKERSRKFLTLNRSHQQRHIKSVSRTFCTVKMVQYPYLGEDTIFMFVCYFAVESSPNEVKQIKAFYKTFCKVQITSN